MVLIADLWVPQLWIQGLQEAQATFPSLFNAGIVTRTPLMDQIASGPGTSVNLPFFKDITDQADEIQVENTAPTTDNGQPSGLMVATPLNRVTKNSGGALAAQVSGADPVRAMVGALGARRLKQRQTTLISLLRGACGTGGARNAAAALSAVRLGGTTAEPFTEDGNAAVAGQLISPTLFINTKTLMGELADELKNGCFLCHPDIKAALEIQDALNFKTLDKPSTLPFSITTYRDIPIFTSSALVRAGTTSGKVYDSYLISNGVVGYGEKPQAGDIIDVSSLQYFGDRDKNNELIWDRTRFILHINGMKWIGNPAGQSATNAELAAPGNWNLVYQTANRVGVTAFRTNG